MRRTISIIAAALMLLSAVVGAQARPASPNACTKGDVQSLAGGTIAVAKQSFREIETGSAGAWSCQFRLYDGNDGEIEDNPEVPHVFTTRDWFLGGIFEWLYNDELTAFGWDRKQGIAFLDSIDDHFYWREQDGSWTELPLTEITHRSVRHPSGEVLPVMHHRYHLFRPGSLAPGTYEWRWDTFDTIFGGFTAHGEVQIVAS